MESQPFQPRFGQAPPFLDDRQLLQTKCPQEAVTKLPSGIENRETRLHMACQKMLEWNQWNQFATTSVEVEHTKHVPSSVTKSALKGKLRVLLSKYTMKEYKAKWRVADSTCSRLFQAFPLVNQQMAKDGKGLTDCEMAFRKLEISRAEILKLRSAGLRGLGAWARSSLSCPTPQTVQQSNLLTAWLPSSPGWTLSGQHLRIYVFARTLEAPQHSRISGNLISFGATARCLTQPLKGNTQDL